MVALTQGCKRQSVSKNESTINTINTILIAQLDTIRHNDQDYRLQINHVEKQFYGRNSNEYKALRVKISEMDSINIIKVAEILDRYGWLSEIELGEDGNRTLF